MLSDLTVTLRAVEPDDIDFIYRMENDRHSWRNGCLRAPMSRFAIKNYIETYNADPLSAGEARFVIVRNSDSQPIGLIDLFEIDSLNRRAGVGIVIVPEQRELGFASVSLMLLSDYCHKDLGLHQLWAVVANDNIASMKLFQGCGFELTGALSQWVRVGTTYLNATLFQKIL